MSREAIDAIRAVRVAAHGLTNVCTQVVGGVEMALSLPTVTALGEDTKPLWPRKRKTGPKK